eukprot:scaffold82502_cov21-Prasinocladus_malaysianus.AAC.1
MSVESSVWRNYTDTVHAGLVEVSSSVLDAQSPYKATHKAAQAPIIPLMRGYMGSNASKTSMSHGTMDTHPAIQANDELYWTSTL